MSEELTVGRLKAALQGKGTEKPRMILDVFREHNKQMCILIEKEEYAEGTLTHFETTLKHVQTFMQKHFQMQDLPLEKVDLPVTKLDYGFLCDFEFYLKSEICAHNTTMKYLGDFKKIVLICVKRGWIAVDPFIGFKMSRRDVEPAFLVDEELEALRNERFL